MSVQTYIVQLGKQHFSFIFRYNSHNKLDTFSTIFGYLRYVVYEVYRAFIWFMCGAEFEFVEKVRGVAVVGL